VPRALRTNVRAIWPQHLPRYPAEAHIELRYPAIIVAFSSLDGCDPCSECFCASHNHCLSTSRKLALSGGVVVGASIKRRTSLARRRHSRLASQSLSDIAPSQETAGTISICGATTGTIQIECQSNLIKLNGRPVARAALPHCCIHGRSLSRNAVL
jgi:hypothetical protein